MIYVLTIMVTGFLVTGHLQEMSESQNFVEATEFSSTENIDPNNFDLKCQEELLSE